MAFTLSLNTNPLVNRFAEPDDLIDTIAEKIRIGYVQLTHEFVNPGWPAATIAKTVRQFRRALDRTGVKITGHQPNGATTLVQIEGSEPLEVEKVMVSVGRRPLSESLGLDGTGVEVDERGFVKVGETCRTTVDGVWAVGDLIATPQLAHVGFAEAIVTIKDILGEAPLPVDYARVPWAIYCQPEVAFAGHSEDSAKEAGFDVVVSKHSFKVNARAWIVNETEDFTVTRTAVGTPFGSVILTKTAAGFCGSKAPRVPSSGTTVGAPPGPELRAALLSAAKDALA